MDTHARFSERFVAQLADGPGFNYTCKLSRKTEVHSKLITNVLLLFGASNNGGPWLLVFELKSVSFVGKKLFTYITPADPRLHNTVNHPKSLEESSLFRD